MIMSFEQIMTHGRNRPAAQPASDPGAKPRYFTICRLAKQRKLRRNHSLIHLILLQKLFCLLILGLSLNWLVEHGRPLFQAIRAYRFHFEFIWNGIGVYTSSVFHVDHLVSSSHGSFLNLKLGVATAVSLTFVLVDWRLVWKRWPHFHWLWRRSFSLIGLPMGIWLARSNTAKATRAPNFRCHANDASLRLSRTHRNVVWYR